jgi:excisionase family DNA binding protein
VTDSADELLTIDEVAGLLKLNRQTIYNYVDRGHLPAVRIGKRRVRIRRSALEKFIATGETDAVAETGPVVQSERLVQGLRPEGRERLAAALADSGDALASEDQDQLARALSNLGGRRSRTRRGASQHSLRLATGRVCDCYGPGEGRRRVGARGRARRGVDDVIGSDPAASYPDAAAPGDVLTLEGGCLLIPRRG